jgi:hypothetical protein
MHAYRMRGVGWGVGGEGGSEIREKDGSSLGADAERAPVSKSDCFGKACYCFEKRKFRKSVRQFRRAAFVLPCARYPRRAQVGLQGLALPITLSLEDLDALTEDKVRGGHRLRVPVLHASLPTGSTHSVKSNQQNR